jgi:hypothetical protein
MRIKVSGLRALLIAVAAVAGLFATAGPAQAVPTEFENGGVYKFKTTWGGGFVLNTGAENGSFVHGEDVQVHWNRNWDNNNRWIAEAQWPEFGHAWYMFRNKHSNLCLYAPPSGNGDVEQRQCDVNLDEFYWAFDAGTWGSDHGKLLNLAHRRAGRTVSLGQDTAALFTRVRMNGNNFASTNEWVVKRCAGAGLPELKSC